MKNTVSNVAISDSIYKDFIENKLNVGDVLPTEKDLIEYYNKSRTTIKRGIEKLIEDNLIYTIKDRGAFVKGKKRDCQIFAISGFSGYATEINITPKTKVLELDIEQVTKEIAEILKLKEGDLVYKTKRIRYLNDVPDHVEIGYLPVALFSDFSVDILAGSKYHYIEKIKKMKIKNSHLIIEPILLDVDTAQLLETQPNIPVLCIKATSFLNNGTVFEYTEMTMNTNKSTISFDIPRLSSS